MCDASRLRIPRIRTLRASVPGFVVLHNSRCMHQALCNRTPMTVWRNGVNSTRAVDMMDNAQQALRPQPQQQQTSYLLLGGRGSRVSNQETRSSGPTFWGHLIAWSYRDVSLAEVTPMYPMPPMPLCFCVDRVRSVPCVIFGIGAANVTSIQTSLLFD
jgi:hypothetical protein